MLINERQAADLIRGMDNILILTHINPDGDALGSAFALARAFKHMNRHARVENNDGIPEKYSYLYADFEVEDFTPEHIIAVDVADVKLLGDRLMTAYGEKVEVCIDHHPSNRLYAKATLLDSTSSSAAEIVLRVIRQLGVPISKGIANGIYTGVSTDTGGFRYANTTPDSLRVGADMIDAGASYREINRAMFEMKSYSYITLEKMSLEGLKIYFGGRVAVITLTQRMFSESGYMQQECDSICAIPRQIEGVCVGATIREKSDGSFKISVRTNDGYDAAAICAYFGGGGHHGAAGCDIQGSLEEVTEAFLAQTERIIKEALN